MYTDAPRKILIPADLLAAKVKELGARITADYLDRPLVVLPVLKGSFVFAADLVRAIDLPLTVEFLGVQSYGDSTKSSGIVRITMDLARPVEGLDVLVVEDIVDTGLTLNYLLNMLRQRGPRSLKVATLLSKPSRRLIQTPVDYMGFEIDDHFVVGYGLDYNEKYRNLRDIVIYGS